MLGDGAQNKDYIKLDVVSLDQIKSAIGTELIVIFGGEGNMILLNAVSNPIYTSQIKGRTNDF